MPANALPRSSTLGPRRSKKEEETAIEHPLLDDDETPRFASSFDGTLTRPGLRRQLRGGTVDERSATVESVPSGSHHRTSSELGGNVLENWSSTPGATSSASTPPDSSTHDTKEVMVHEVQPTDSLAGVALRYGITVAALRRANKLWPSDSIHLRKVLYIPVNWQRKYKPILISEVEEISSGSHAITTRADLEGQPTQHIPASELSFFPTRPSLFSDVEPPSPTPGSFTLPTFSRRTVPSVIDVFSKGIDAISRISTESLSSMGRTSASEDLATSADEVELDLARTTWQNTPSSAALSPPLLHSRTTPIMARPNPYRATASSLIDIRSRSHNANVMFTDMQPQGKPPMTIPVSLGKKR